MKIYPSILTDSFDLAQDELNKLQAFEAISVAQIDLVDGFFADNLTLGIEALAELDFGRLQADLHFMVDEPMDFLVELFNWEGQIPVRAVIAQLERMSFQEDFLLESKKHGWLAGFSLNLFTPLEEIDKNVWQLLDVLQLMSIADVGQQGQNFNDLVFPRIKTVRELINQHNPEIELIVDGGVKEQHLSKLSDLGVNGVAPGSAIWQSDDFEQAVAGFTNYID